MYAAFQCDLLFQAISFATTALTASAQQSSTPIYFYLESSYLWIQNDRSPVVVLIRGRQSCLDESTVTLCRGALFNRFTPLLRPFANEHAQEQNQNTETAGQSEIQQRQTILALFAGFWLPSRQYVTSEAVRAVSSEDSFLSYRHKRLDEFSRLARQKHFWFMYISVQKSAVFSIFDVSNSK